MERGPRARRRERMLLRLHPVRASHRLNEHRSDQIKPIDHGREIFITLEWEGEEK